jgi:hypothetical protein
MYLGQNAMVPLSFAWKLGLHLVTLACLAGISSSFPKKALLGPMYGNDSTSL